MSQATQLHFPVLPSLVEEAAMSGDRDPSRLRGRGLDVLMIDGEPWFAARDVGAILGLANVRQSVAYLDDDERGVTTADTPGGQQAVSIVSEAGLYSLIMRSRVPAAGVFKRWVTHDVLPAIRKTGRYVEPAVPKTRVELARELLDAEERAEKWRETATEQLELLGRAHGMLKAVEPKVEAFDDLMDADGTFSLAQAAQLVGVGRQTLIDRLAEWKVIMIRPGHSDHLRPYQAQVHLGRFACVAQTVDITHGDGTTEKLVKSTTRVTAKGVDWIRVMLKAGGPRAALARVQ
jgi:anti-repressor protein